MKKFSILILLIFFSVSIYSVEEIEKLMVEKAESQQEKKAVHEYLMGESAQKKKMAERLRKIANTKKGGKANTQINNKKEMLEEADALDALAEDYKELAKKLKQ